MKKNEKAPRSTKAAQKRKIVTKDLKAKDAESVKGGLDIATQEGKVFNTQIKLDPVALKITNTTSYLK